MRLGAFCEFMGVIMNSIQVALSIAPQLTLNTPTASTSFAVKEMGSSVRISVFEEPPLNVVSRPLNKVLSSSSIAIELLQPPAR